MQSVAVGWQLYEITHPPLALGLAGLAQFLPGICLFLLAGHVADRKPRQRILQTCVAAFSICSLLLLTFALRHISSPYPIYATLLLNGTVRAFNAPASQAFLPLLVPRGVFPNAVAWNSSVFQVATIAGPMFGGLLYGSHRHTDFRLRVRGGLLRGGIFSDRRIETRGLGTSRKLSLPSA